MKRTIAALLADAEAGEDAAQDVLGADPTRQSIQRPGGEADILGRQLHVILLGGGAPDELTEAEVARRALIERNPDAKSYPISGHT